MRYQSLTDNCLAFAEYPDRKEKLLFWQLEDRKSLDKS